jgi:hypothetical protein
MLEFRNIYDVDVINALIELQLHTYIKNKFPCTV